MDSKRTFKHRSDILPQISNWKMKGISFGNTLAVYRLWKSIWLYTKKDILFDILEPRNIPDTLLKATADIQTQNKILIQFQTIKTGWN